MNKKMLIVSLALSAFIFVSLNPSLAENPEPGPVSIAVLDIETFEGNVLSFAVSNIVIYLILTGIVYVFVRSVCRSFGKMS